MMQASPVSFQFTPASYAMSDISEFQSPHPFDGMTAKSLLLNRFPWESTNYAVRPLELRGLIG